MKMLQQLALDAFSKLRKATISFTMPVSLHGTTGLSMGGFSCNVIFEDFSKNYLENSSLIKI